MVKKMLRLAWWDILENEAPPFLFLRGRYLNEFQAPKRMFISSSIRQGIKEPFFALQSESRWLVGESSSVYFWLDDWVGFSIADRLGIPTPLPITCSPLPFPFLVWGL